MPLYICSLNSGSNGNCYYVGHENGAVLIDAGISCRETVKRMDRAGLDISLVKAIFISHEHSDHIRGVETLSKTFRLPVYITPATRQNAFLKLEDSLCRTFSTGVAVEIEDLNIIPFAKHHDASDPHSFVVEHQGTRVGVFTDIGQRCERLAEHFSTCHAAFLESNYDEEMLRNGPYPFYLKRRISGGQGHLSNNQALQLFLNCRRPDLSHLLLAHLSAENNCPSLVADVFKPHAGNTQVVVASRHEESNVYTIYGEEKAALPKHTEKQLTLF